MFETDLQLLGVTGLEDLLQENVAECVKDFQKAEIKVWMLTGDKGETASSIGVSCGLINTKIHEIYDIKSISRDDILNEIKLIEEEVTNLGKTNLSKLDSVLKPNQIHINPIKAYESGEEGSMTDI